MNEHTAQHISMLAGYASWELFEISEIEKSYSSSADVIIIDFANPYLRDVNEEDLCKSLEDAMPLKNWIIITSNCYYYNKQHPRIIYYPIYLIDGIDKTVWPDVEYKQKRQYSFNFLTYHMHWHRILVFLQLQEHYLMSKGLVNLVALNDMNDSQSNGYKNAVRSLTQLEKKELSELMKLAPIVADSNDDQREIVNIQNRAFSDSYLNLFTESDFPSCFVTEKSIKPFMAGQFTAVLAHNNVYSHLKELGFDMFEDLILLNTTNDVRETIANTVTQLAQLIPQLPEYWNNTYNRRRRNYNLARSPELRQKLCNALQEKLNEI